MLEYMNKYEEKRNCQDNEMYYIFLMPNFAEHCIHLIKYIAITLCTILALLKSKFKFTRIKNSQNSGTCKMT